MAAAFDLVKVSTSLMEAFLVEVVFSFSAKAVLVTFSLVVLVVLLVVDLFDEGDLFVELVTSTSALALVVVATLVEVVLALVLQARKRSVPPRQPS